MIQLINDINWNKSSQINKISILKLEGNIKEISYERCDDESVAKKSLS